jgi:spermidine/putrescine transport system permease protein
VPVERPGISPLYERSPVRPSNTVLLGEGGTVRARDVVVATNAAAAGWGPVRGRMTVFGFTLANWQNPFGVPGLRESIVLSLAFALSVDDFVITNVNAGAEVTFPMYVWGAARVGVPPQVNVIGTVIFLLAIVAMLGNVLLQMRRKGTT